MLKTLPGITVTYMVIDKIIVNYFDCQFLLIFYYIQGEELGMTDVYISWEDTVDPQGIDLFRV